MEEHYIIEETYLDRLFKEKKRILYKGGMRSQMEILFDVSAKRRTTRDTVVIKLIDTQTNEVIKQHGRRK